MRSPFLSMHDCSRGAEANKYYNAGRALAVDRREECRFAVKRDLPAQSRGHAGNEVEIVVIAKGVRLDARQKPLSETGRLGLEAEKKLVGAVAIPDARPDPFV